jgi:hypothetical protein
VSLAALLAGAAPRLERREPDELYAWLGAIARVRDVPGLFALTLQYSQSICAAVDGGGGTLDYERVERIRIASAGRWWRLNALELHFTAIRETLRAICAERSVSAATAHVSGYLHGAGASVPRHCDRPSVISVQVFGTRHWKLAENGPPQRGLDDPVPPPVPFERWDPAFPPSSVHLPLNPGAVLGVPSGWWHQTWSPEPSFAISFVVPES